MNSRSLTVSELSRRLGRSRAAILKLARKGRIPRNADGTFDEAAVRLAYARNVDPAWRSALRKATSEAAVRGVAAPGAPASSPDSPAPTALIARVLAEEGFTLEGPLTGEDARMAEAILRCRKLALELATAEREFLPREPVERHVANAYAALCREVEAFPARYAGQIAAAVGRDVAAVQTAISRTMAELVSGWAAPAIKA